MVPDGSATISLTTSAISVASSGRDSPAFCTRNELAPSAMTTSDARRSPSSRPVRTPTTRPCSWIRSSTVVPGTSSTPAASACAANHASNGTRSTVNAFGGSDGAAWGTCRWPSVTALSGVVSQTRSSVTTRSIGASRPAVRRHVGQHPAVHDAAHHVLLAGPLRALEQHDAEPGPRHRQRGRGAAGTGPDDDRVELFAGTHDAGFYLSARTACCTKSQNPPGRIPSQSTPAAARASARPTGKFARTVTPSGAPVLSATYATRK